MQLDSAFYGCVGLSSIEWYEGLKTLEGSAFYNCCSLESIVFPNGLESIGTYCFYGCSSLKNVTFNDNLKIVSSYAFAYTDLTSFILPDSLNTIGSNIIDDDPDTSLSDQHRQRCNPLISNQIRAKWRCFQHIF